MELANWYAIYTKARCEKKVGEELTRLNIEHYVPLVRVLSVWSDRKKWVDKPLFNSYVFVKISISSKDEIMSVPGVVSFVHFGSHIPVIPDNQISSLKILLGSEEKFDLSTDDFKIGDKVRVTAGSCKGLEGHMLEIRGENKMLLRIDVLNQNISLEVNPLFLEKMPHTED